MTMTERALFSKSRLAFRFWGAMLCIIVFFSNSLEASTECQLQGHSEVKKKFLYIEDTEKPVTLLTSRRVPNQLVTEVVAIFLRHHLGYVNVILKYHDGFLPQDVLKGMGYPDNIYSISDNFTPSAIASMEMWSPPTFNPSDYHPFITTSYMGVVGRFGWFFPFYAIEKFHVLDHWRTFTRSDSEALRVFSRTEKELSDLDSLLRDPRDTTSYNCKDSRCERGIFTPPKCSTSTGQKCAVLFAGRYNESGFLIDHVLNMSMFVRVAWLGDGLDKDFLSSNQRFYGDRSVLFYHYTPDVLQQPFNITSVTFPSCADHIEYIGMNKLYFCMYEMHRLNKIIWGGLKSSDIYLQKSLERVTLTGEKYDELIQEYNRDPQRPLHDIACSWMQKNQRIWTLWRSSDSTPALYFIGLFPVTTSAEKRKFVDPGNVPAFTMAIEDVSRNESILPGHSLQHIIVNTACEPDIVMLNFINIIQYATRKGRYSKIVGIVGPACSDTVEPLAGVSKYFQMPIISYGAEGAIFSDRDHYPYFFRTIPENKNYGRVYLQLFKKFGWRRVASLTEDGQQYSEYLTPLQDLLQDNGISLNMRKYPQVRKSINMTQYLQDLKERNFRIIIGDFYQEMGRLILCEAYHLRMTGRQGYVWFLPRWFSYNWYDVDKLNESKSNSLHAPCTTKEMIEALQGHMSLSYKYFADDDSLTPSNQTVKEWKKHYRNVTKRLKIAESDFAGFTYDAVWTYALALDKLFKEDHSYTSNLRSSNTTDRFIYHINNTDFEGVSGNINFHHGPSRITDINIWQFTGDDYRKIGWFFPEKGGESGSMELQMSEIVWPSKSLPKDGSKECIVESFRALLGEEVTCNTAVVALCTTSFVPLALFLLLIVLFLKRRYEAKLRLMEEMWKDQSIFKKFEGWEIARSQVVINRKLGEGQFGTVYGGECLVESMGWSAVAVKTLKVGSTITEKLDFLSEAEMMKNFDHENIVKLLGVCTEDEPIYTVMEFMLYGDLKTYLLARRNLVSETNRGDDDEVNNRRLTSMALDVARALAYLANLSYVHRDVACRNCLVNTHRRVKLADFGMTRQLNEKNYYRFSRKGMLPVRWMAPESLVEGVFTTSSDIWSYGVLLYEVITFGAFPFQGLNNNQVFEKVKSGHTLPIPGGIQPSLECLLQACWHQVPSKRLTAAQIAVHLENSPLLISPSLEAPQASLPIENSAGLQMAILPDKGRKLSLSLNNRALNAAVEMPSDTSSVSFVGSSRKRSMSGNMMGSTPANAVAVLSPDLEALNLNDRLALGVCEPSTAEDPLLPSSQYISSRFLSLSHRGAGDLLSRSVLIDSGSGSGGGCSNGASSKDLWSSITPV